MATGRWHSGLPGCINFCQTIKSIKKKTLYAAARKRMSAKIDDRGERERVNKNGIVTAGDIPCSPVRAISNEGIEGVDIFFFASVFLLPHPN